MNTLIGGVSLLNLRSVWLPYYLQRRPDGAYIPFNRQHRPIGCKERDNIDTCPIAFFISGMTPRLAARLSHFGSTNMEKMYLYNEFHKPETVKEMGRYIARLVLLAKQHVEYSDMAQLKLELGVASRAIAMRVSVIQIPARAQRAPSLR
jgi:hypothetical protein